MHACAALQLEYRTSKEEFYFKGSLNRTHYKTLPTYTYISLRHKAQKALTFSFRPLRFTARALRVARDFHQTVRLSFSIIMIILLHVVSGEPGLIPGRCQSSKKLPPFTLTSWAMKDICSRNCFTISHRIAHDQDNFLLADLTDMQQ